MSSSCLAGFGFGGSVGGCFLDSPLFPLRDMPIPAIRMIMITAAAPMMYSGGVNGGGRGVGVAVGVGVNVGTAIGAAVDIGTAGQIGVGVGVGVRYIICGVGVATATGIGTGVGVGVDVDGVEMVTVLAEDQLLVAPCASFACALT